MPKFNIDEQVQLSEPIEITLEGKEYVVAKITTQKLKEVTDIGKEKSLEAPMKQLALLVNVDSKEFENVELRKISKALEFITSTIESGLTNPKNSPGVATP